MWMKYHYMRVFFLKSKSRDKLLFLKITFFLTFFFIRVMTTKIIKIILHGKYWKSSLEMVLRISLREMRYRKSKSLENISFPSPIISYNYIFPSLKMERRIIEITKMSEAESFKNHLFHNIRKCDMVWDNSLRGAGEKFLSRYISYLSIFSKYGITLYHRNCWDNICCIHFI